MQFHSEEEESKLGEEAEVSKTADRIFSGIKALAVSRAVF